MHIYIGVDHRGYHLRGQIKQWVGEALGEEVEITDLSGKNMDIEDDYVDIGIAVAEKVALGGGLGILVCGSGIGMCVVANKVAGVRAGLCNSVKQAIAGRRDDNINVLCLGADELEEADMGEIVLAFLGTPFAPEERFVRRLNKIKKYESITSG